MADLRLDENIYAVQPGQTVLDALLEHGVAVDYRCQNGVCLSCLMRCSEGELPVLAQKGLRETLRARGYFLACQCRPRADLSLERIDAAQIRSPARVVDKQMIAPDVCRLRLDPATPLYYHAGQFINLVHPGGTQRSYSLASVPQTDAFLELHVKRVPDGLASGWIHDELACGDSVQFEGPYGGAFYLPGRAQQPILLIATGTGLAPVLGVARDALRDGHAGRMVLYHGSRFRTGLYATDQLAELAGRFPNFDYRLCLSGGDDGLRGPWQAHVGRAGDLALAEHRILEGWRVFICGNPTMVKAVKRAAYLGGAALADIHGDPFIDRQSG
ncbi:MAG: FAD-binding oxidoreductase [Xanthomonadaceae bacterium]|nr:FAD-binding oxidoreductase [Xanthomonadaceae bacterium]